MTERKADALDTRDEVAKAIARALVSADDLKAVHEIAGYIKKMMVPARAIAARLDAWNRVRALGNDDWCDNDLQEALWDATGYMAASDSASPIGALWAMLWLDLDHEVSAYDLETLGLPADSEHLGLRLSACQWLFKPRDDD